MATSEWINLYGDYQKTGVSLRRVQGHGSGDIASVLESGALHLFMNLSGDSFVFGDACRLSLSTKTLSCCMIGDKTKFMATNLPGDELHELIVLCVTPQWVVQHFGSKKQSLHAALQKLIAAKGEQSLQLYKVRSMSYLEYEISASLLSPPVHPDAKPFWFLAKIIEILSLHIFQSPTLSPSEPFCSGQKRTARQRVDKALIWLRENYNKPLDLASMAKYANCSSSYLSRTFSENVGKTISRKLRELRVQRAKEMLDSGDYNVTEVAMEVGYSSVSHFTKAFKTETGSLPSESMD